MFVEEENERLRVKICGLTTLNDARFVAGEGADYLGFIFYEESDRYIKPAEAGAIINWVEGPQCVGVFVNHPLDEVNRIAKQTGINFIQLHGNESPEYCDLIDKPVIKAFHIDQDTDPEQLQRRVESYHDSIDYVLFDTKLPGSWGGTGKTFDWKVVQEITEEWSCFLSGGIHRENIEEACNVVSPFAVDLASGVEMEPGVKDYEEVELFFERVRALEDKR
jgi:phosphoribosylanthranilate isomerase